MDRDAGVPSGSAHWALLRALSAQGQWSAGQPAAGFATGPAAGREAGAGVSEGDQELVARCRAGEPAAFEELVRRYQAPLVRYARGMVGNAEDARDMAQEAFVRAYTHLDRFDPRGRFSSWLYSIATHVCIDWIRRRSRRAELDQRLGEPEGPPEPEDVAMQGEQARLVRLAVSELPVEYRHLVLLHYGEGMSCAEAARVVNISHGAARVRLFRAREMLRQKLGALFAGEKVER